MRRLPIMLCLVAGCGQNSPITIEVKPTPRTYAINSPGTFGIRGSWGLMTRDFTLTNNWSQFDRLEDVDLIVTLKKTTNGESSQKTASISRWPQGGNIEIKGFDGGNDFVNGSGVWNVIEIRGTARHGDDTVNINISETLDRK